MAKISLDNMASIDGFQAAALVDCDSGLSLASIGSGLNTEVAAASNTEIINAKRRVANSLNNKDSINDLLITFEDSYHMILPLRRNNDLFLYLALDRSRSNLAMALHELKTFESELDFA